MLFQMGLLGDNLDLGSWNVQGHSSQISYQEGLSWDKE